MINISEKYEDIANVLKILAHPARLNVIKILLTEGPMNVTTLCEKLKMTQSTVSQHLNRLKRAEIVTSTREGLMTYYEVVDNRAKIIYQIMCK
ncbi:ArsR/SmtB family transcription factor [Bacillus sp. BP-3]|uniref:ArsR/SmtB family transcription factor n=1 Tax=Bacillus sp. BP-3 TaxID=3022773 RepID=UPI00232F4F03|nr:metalloregulator ArsR/SmtB family transcription factor [Bacillus sp. BP-3]MDC2867928.1 metalloregulator ArsR/SmtB family transcription factor [Bacillus sp. BP-3]